MGKKYMEFIRATLCEAIIGNKSLNELGKVENYLLPICGIKTIVERESEPGIYYIHLCESHIPNEDEYGFKIDHAIAKLHNSFIDIVN